jgi:alpha/beta superfamily hydrolase
MLVEVFTQIVSVFSCLSSRESQEIFRRVILQQPNVMPVTMTTPDNVQLDGVYLKNNDDADATTLVLCNPNAVAYEEYFNELDPGYRDSQGKPFNYLYFNYRGVGRSEGSPTPDGLLIDSYTVVKFLQEAFGVPRKKIITHGWSIGGPMASFAAFENQGEAADGSDSVSCCNDRSMSSLPKEIEYFVSTGYNNCCIPVIAATIAKWSGWNWDVMEWWRGINGYKWTVVNRGDQVVPYDVSLSKAWQEESHDESRGRILEMQASPDGHMRPFHPIENEIQRRHMARASSP